MPKINIDGIGMVELDDSFTSLSADDQNATIEQIIESQTKPEIKGKKEYDWISDVTGTIGSVIGGVSGAIGGSLLGPVGTAGGAVAGSSAGGAAGGALGEYIEGYLDPQGREDYDIKSTAIEEGVFGLIPGAGGLLTKGGLRAGSRVLSKLPIIGKFLGTDQVTKEFAKFSAKQKKQVLDPIINDFYAKLPKGAKIKSKLKSDLINLGYGSSRVVDEFFKKYKGVPKFEKAVDEFYTQLVSNGIVKGAIAEQGIKNIVELNKDQ